MMKPLTFLKQEVFQRVFMPYQYKKTLLRQLAPDGHLEKSYQKYRKTYMAAEDKILMAGTAALGTVVSMAATFILPVSFVGTIASFTAIVFTANAALTLKKQVKEPAKWARSLKAQLAMQTKEHIKEQLLTPEALSRLTMIAQEKQLEEKPSSLQKDLIQSLEDQNSQKFLKVRNIKLLINMNEKLMRS